MHAFVPHPHVDHTHPDAIVSLATCHEGERHIKRLYGERVGWIPYMRLGFTLSKAVGLLVRARPQLEGIVLGEHSLVCWGETARACYDRCCAWNSSPEVLDFVGSAQACPLACTASACPDHIVHTKHYPLSLEWDGQSVAELEAQIPHAVRHYCEAYQAYFEVHRTQAVLVRGYFLVAHAAFRLWQAQGIGGNLIFITSKNALSAGKGAVAYSAAKASELHMARCLAEEGGAFGIRVNSMAPDAVLQGSRIWESAWRAERTCAYGVASDQLEAYYRERTTLKG